MKRITDIDRIKQIFGTAPEPEAKMLLAVAQVIMWTRFDASRFTEKKQRKSKPVPIEQKGSAA